VDAGRVFVAIVMFVLAIVSLFREPNDDRELRAVEGATMLQRRLGNVYRRRLAGEQRDLASRFALAFVVLFLGIAILLTKVEVSTIYAVLFLGTALVQLRRYLRRRVPSRTAASLLVRTQISAVPTYAFAIAGIVAFGPLTDVKDLGWISWAATFSALSIVVLAWKTAASPSRLDGMDPELEIFVDNRMRKMRTLGMLQTACFVTALVAYGGSATIRNHVTLWMMLANVGVLLWLGVWQYRAARRVRASDLTPAALQHA